MQMGHRLRTAKALDSFMAWSLIKVAIDSISLLPLEVLQRETVHCRGSMEKGEADNAMNSLVQNKSWKPVLSNMGILLS